ncbi:MAG TPA: neutral/alkaline non-lysosomal ceramidase N-terminal domain-containing protein [Acidobacteriota bacterium]|nr:neutral/alkaline non-lysosomal ceramidase N-terminal domain-containing protein [Acidobacteriota bacterium]
MYRFRTFFLILFGCLVLSSSSLAQSTWKAGTARVDITPTESIWLAGYGARDRPSSGVLQNIFAKALALQDQDGLTFVLVTADILGFTAEMSETIAERVQTLHGLSRERLILNASHTHSAPVTGNLLWPAYSLGPEHVPAIERYTSRLLDQIVEMIGVSLSNLEPVELHFGQGLAGFAVNRRRVSRRYLPGPVDHDVPVLAVRSLDGAIKAVVFGYACHATVLSGYEVNGDWPGFAQEAIEERYLGATALFVTGCGADANPLPRRSVELARRYGDTLAIAVAEVLESEMKPVKGPLRVALEQVDLPFQTPPTREELEWRVKTESDSRKRHAQTLLEKLDQEGSLPSKYPYPVQVVQFGSELTFIHLAGEVVVDYSLRFKEAYGWDDTWVAGYSNDVFAYIPSKRVLHEGGYEGGGAMIGYGQPRPFTAEVEEMIANKVDELVKRTSGGMP